MSATLKLTHKTIGVEVRRGTYDVVVDGKRAESLELNETIRCKNERDRLQRMNLAPLLVSELVLPGVGRPPSERLGCRLSAAPDRPTYPTACPRMMAPIVAAMCAG